jgi:hypothetical protein
MNASSTHLDELAEARSLIVRLWDRSLAPAEHGRLEALINAAARGRAAALPGNDAVASCSASMGPCHRGLKRRRHQRGLQPGDHHPQAGSALMRPQGAADP